MYEAYDTHEWCGDYKIYFIVVTFDDKYYDSIKNEIDLVVRNFLFYINE